MKNKNRILIIAALVAIILFSCPQEPGDPGTGNTHDSDGSGTGNPNPTVYLCTVTTTGAYYVNGTKRGDLDISGTQVYYGGISCTVSGGKVYVGGNYYSGYAYWVDGVRTDLSIPAGTSFYYTRPIVVSDGKAYIWGSYENAGTNKACYWVDGVRTDLDIPNGYTTYNYYNPVFAISNGRVYAAGSYSSYHYNDYGYREDEKSRQACYWINGIRTDLSVPAGIEFSEARSITVSGGKVYVSGSYGNLVDYRYMEKACYWVDGVRTDLNIPAETERSVARNLIVSGGKVYVSGSYGNYEDYAGQGYNYFYMGKACYWVDGVRTDLDIPTGTDSSDSSASNLIVSGGKVYLLGETRNYSYGDMKFCYWVDGMRTDLVVPDEAEIAFMAYYLTVSDGKVYVYGDSYPADRGVADLQYYRGAFYWVDGVRTNFDVYHRGISGFGSRYFAVADGKVHVAAGAGYTEGGPGPFEMA